MIDFKTYITELQSIAIDQLTEHSKRSALEALLHEVLNNVLSINEIKILHEPKRKENYGSPDFKIYSASSIIGYVENKKIGENLNKIIASPQIQKYRELSPNLLITNYLDFVWIKGDTIQSETLCSVSDLDDKNLSKSSKLLESSQKIENLLINFFSQATIGISNAHDLAIALAVRARNLKNYLTDNLENQYNTEFENTDSLLNGLYKTFKTHVFNELTISEFSDAFAQMLVYGLFLAKLNADNKEVTLYTAKQYIPQSFELIRELVGFLDELDNEEYKDTRWIIEETISIMNNLDLAELKKSLSFQLPESFKLSESSELSESYGDPYIYFYETFLAAYDSKLRKAKGVYYTPPQVVNFIVRAINQVLKNTFGIENGFAQSEKVTVLDFATGTGTFLIEILKQIFETISPQNEAFKQMLIKEHILKNFYGFEYLIAPYTVAHLKLSQFLKENNYELQGKERFQLFLTNTLEPVADIPPNIFTKALSAEGKLAQKIKDKSILVITGNPPYSGHSKNTGAWISNLLRGNDIWAKEKIEKQANYFLCDNKPLGERNPKWLQDDYVKFIRFAQYKIDSAGQGIVGIITNHSFLDNPTFRGMRQSLMQSFDQLYFIDLHGNAKKREKSADGKADQNVFDIEQGVAISIFIKNKNLADFKNPQGLGRVFHTDFRGSRKQKFDLCINNSIDTLNFTEVKPNSPFYLFVPLNETLRKQYDSFYDVKNIFEKNSLGILTHRDHFLVDFERNSLYNKINSFKHSDNPYQAKSKFDLEDTRDWKVEEALIKLKKNEIVIESYNYRPFDERYICYNDELVERRRYEIMQHLLNHENKSLILGRAGQNVEKGLWNLCFVSNKISDANIFYRGGGTTFPLYLYEVQKKTLFKKEKPQKQLSKYEQELNEHTERFNKAVSEIRRHEQLFAKNQHPSQDKIDYFEEHRSTFEEYKTTYEKLKEHYNKLIGTTLKEIKESEENKIEFLEDGVIKRPNFSTEFIQFIRQKYTKNYSPEQIFSYIYAVLHSPTYREKYADFLKIDFPKIPFCEDESTFENLSDLGTQLIKYHLFEEIPSGIEYKDFGQMCGEGQTTVEKTEFNANRLYINKNIYFDTISEEVYNFYIGGYQVLDKYLKDRKGKELQMNEVLNVAKIVKVISFTLKQMELIDNEIVEWI